MNSDQVFDLRQMLAAVPFRVDPAVETGTIPDLISLPQRRSASVLVSAPIQSMLRAPDQARAVAADPTVSHEASEFFDDATERDPAHVLPAQQADIDALQAAYLSVGPEQTAARDLATNAILTFQREQTRGPFSYSALLFWSQNQSLTDLTVNDLSIDEAVWRTRVLHPLRNQLDSTDAVPSLNPNSDIQPITRGQPEYPIAAAQRGIGGRVMFEFDVDEQGRPINIQIVESSPRGVFDHAARRAIEQFRYEPLTVDGTPVIREDVRFAFEFQVQR